MVAPECTDAPAPPPTADGRLRRALRWTRRHPRVGLGIAVVVLLGAGVYTAVAVSGLRRVEAAWLEAQALGDQYRLHLTSLSVPAQVDFRITVGDDPEERIRRLTTDYGERMTALAEQAHDVVAVDPRVRRARAAVVLELRSVARDTRSAATTTLLTLGPAPYAPGVAPALDAARSFWRVDPGTPPTPAPLATVARRRTTPPLHDEPTGTRLLTLAGGRLLEIDIDGGAVHDRGPARPFVVRGDRIVAVDGDGAAVQHPDGGRRRLPVAGDMLVADAEHGASVWVVERPDGGAEHVISITGRVSVEGDVEVAPRRMVGDVFAAAGRWVATMSPPRSGGLAVYDTDTGRVRFRDDRGAARAMWAGTLLWVDGDARLRVRDLAQGTDRSITPPPGHSGAGRASPSPDGRRVAVPWSDGGRFTVTVYDTADLRAEPTPLALGGHPPSLAWSRDGAWLFALAHPDGNDMGSIHAWRVGGARAEPLHIRGRFLALAAL